MKYTISIVHNKKTRLPKVIVFGIIGKRMEESLSIKFILRDPERNSDSGVLKGQFPEIATELNFSTTFDVSVPVPTIR